MAAGVTQPGGAGTTVYIYDDTHADAGGDGAYSFADILAALDILNPGQTDLITLTAGERVMYFFSVSLQVGDTTTNAATTTLSDTNVEVFFETGKSLAYRSTQTTSWFTTFGTKVGTGNVSGAKNGCTIVTASGAAPTLRGTIKCYDSRFVMNGAQALIFSPVSSGGSELVNCSLINTSTGNFTIGSTPFKFSSLYNVWFSGAPTALLIANIGSDSSNKITLSATSLTTFFGLAVANLTFVNWAFEGTPTAGDFRWGNSGSTNWTVVRPVWSQNGPKFAQVGAGSMAVANGAKEYWQFNVKVVNASGTAIANVPVKVTDTLGNIQVNTTTDANGRISFGSAPTANMCIVMDHYTVTGTYNQRHRGPFLFEYNTGNSRNTDYQSLRGYAKWPGQEGVSTTAGTFEDLNTVVHLQYAAGGATTWTEREMP